jgi:hypothetical protein
MRHRHADLKASIACNVRSLGGAALSKLGTVHEGKGWPDLFLAHPRGPAGGCWLEVKVGRDRIRPEQAERIAALRAGGAHAWVLRESEGGLQEVSDERGANPVRLEKQVGEGPGTLRLLDVLRILSELRAGPNA